MRKGRYALVRISTKLLPLLFYVGPGRIISSHTGRAELAGHAARTRKQVKLIF